MQKIDINEILNKLLTHERFIYNDILFFAGGADVNPKLYNEKNICSYTDIMRDTRDQEAYEKYKDLPKVGICRGNQFLSVMKGSKLIQDMRHPSSHFVIDEFGDKFRVTSTHHQMVYPFNCDPNDYKILWASFDPNINKEECCSISPHHYGADDKVDGYKEVESIFWKEKDGYAPVLGVQGHPEFVRDYIDRFPDFVKKFEDLIQRYILC